MRIPTWKLLALSGIGLFALTPLWLRDRSDHGNAAAAESGTSASWDDDQRGFSGGEPFALDPFLIDGVTPPIGDPDPSWIDPATLPPEAVELTDLRADAGPWFGRRVRFLFQFAGARLDWEPYLTRFGPTDFVALDAWGDREYPWDQDVYANPAGTLFARRGSVVEASLALARPHQRFEAVGIVRDVFLDEPWIEIQSLTRRPEHVPEGTILHVQQARAFRKLEQWDLALDQLQRALSAPLPEHAREALEALVGGVEADRAAVDERKRKIR